ncbi:MAG: hypothetical protein N4A40_12835 [Tissierellales bacterium]|jgi:hypothetical protein|nr:hypothetical protein [Tissierellales bacterium]
MRNKEIKVIILGLFMLALGWYISTIWDLGVILQFALIFATINTKDGNSNIILSSTLPVGAISGSLIIMYKMGYKINIPIVERVITYNEMIFSIKTVALAYTLSAITIIFLEGYRNRQEGHNI